MLRFWLIIYNIFLIPSLWIGFKIISLFNTKVREGFKGRKNLLSKIKSSNKSIYTNSILIHSSSLGEFQQAIPVAEQIFETSPDTHIIFSFFSPSGFNNSKILFKNSEKTYLPFDSIRNVRMFLDFYNPKMIMLMRYDLWLNFLFEAKKRNIKIVITNARFDEKDFTWKIPVLKSFKEVLFSLIDTLFVIDDDDEKNYKKYLKSKNTSIIKVGDSKFERVFKIANDFKSSNPLPEYIVKDKKIFVIGSSWKDDEDIILPVVDKILEYDDSLLTILVPHEPKETKITAIENTLLNKYENIKSIRYSNINNYKNENLIIVDSVGKLISFYSIAYLSYVGGGFRTGLHNILEPITFKVPVFFSNNVKNSDEDEIILQTGCGFIVKDTLTFYRDFRTLMINTKLRNEVSEKCLKVFDEKLGTAKKIIDYLYV